MPIPAKTWKQPSCPSVGEWIKNWSIRTMKYYPVLKGNEFQAVKRHEGILNAHYDMEEANLKKRCTA